jgi:hypothetical protein
MSYHATTTMGKGMIAGRPSRRAMPHTAPTLADRLQETGTRDGMTRAIAAYRKAQPAMTAELRADMAARLIALTGQTIASETIFVESHTRTAIAVVENVVFRLVDQELVVLRPCAYCGTGQFASPAIHNVVDLGYALSEWEPLHDDCAPEDPRE